MTPREAAPSLAPLAALAALVLLAPTAAAHAAPNPLSVETHLIQDEGEDAFYWTDGYDLYNLHARNAYWAPADAEGVIFRLDLYGGFSPNPSVDALHIDIGHGEGENATALRMTTTNDQNWTGDLTIVSLDVTEESPPWTGVTAKMQLFASYAQLGLAQGDNLTGVWMKSYAGDTLVDEAPGGYYLPGSGGNGEVPAPSERLVDAYPLAAPTGYTNTTANATEGAVTFTVRNALAETGQHVQLRLHPAAGWNATLQGAPAASVNAGNATTFTVNATASPDATLPLAVEIYTDLGGREWWYVGADGATLTAATTPDGAPVTVEEAVEETPAPTWLAWVALGAVAAVLTGKRRGAGGR